MSKIIYRLHPDQLLKLLAFAYEEGVMGYLDLAEATADSILENFVKEYPECCVQSEKRPTYMSSSSSAGQTADGGIHLVSSRIIF